MLNRDISAFVLRLSRLLGFGEGVLDPFDQIFREAIRHALGELSALSLRAGERFPPREFVIDLALAGTSERMVYLGHHLAGQTPLVYDGAYWIVDGGRSLVPEFSEVVYLTGGPYLYLPSASVPFSHPLRLRYYLPHRIEYLDDYVSPTTFSPVYDELLLVCAASHACAGMARLYAERTDVQANTAELYRKLGLDFRRIFESRVAVRGVSSVVLPQERARSVLLVDSVPAPVLYVRAAAEMHNVRGGSMATMFLYVYGEVSPPPEDGNIDFTGIEARSEEPPEGWILYVVNHSSEVLQFLSRDPRSHPHNQIHFWNDDPWEISQGWRMGFIYDGQGRRWLKFSDPVRAL